MHVMYLKCHLKKIATNSDFLIIYLCNQMSKILDISNYELFWVK